MKDIARECKVSVATVSIALSGSAKKGRISESKLEEIRADRQAVELFSKQQCIQSGQRQEQDNRCCHQ